MKQKSNKSRGISKGAPSAFVISLIVHVAAFMLAGLLVVFTVTLKEEKKFMPPKPIDRPKMKLKKPKVAIKKTSKPKSTNRIVTNVKKTSMPNIQLPEMGGMGAGVGGGIGDFEIMPDLTAISAFGNLQSIGNDFVGTFYDLKRSRNGSPRPMVRDQAIGVLSRFIRSGWRRSNLAEYYQSPRKLYTSVFAVPPIHASLSPAAFGEEDTVGYCWAAHYKGQLVYPEDIEFRFWGQADDALIVRVNNEIVSGSVWLETRTFAPDPRFTPLLDGWQSSSPDSYKYALGNNLAVVGDWIKLEPGVAKDMEVLIVEANGGLFSSLLCVEVRGAEYPKNPHHLGGMTLPVFKTSVLSRDLVELIQADLDAGDARLANGFCDYKQNVDVFAPMPEPEVNVVEDKELPLKRTWILETGKELEAEYRVLMGGNVVLENAKGRQIKIPLTELSEQDRLQIELLNPPKLKLDFSKHSAQIQPPKAPPDQSPPMWRIFDFTFGAKIKQESSGDYEHPLTVEYIAYGNHVNGPNYVLLDRQKEEFTLTKENNRSHEVYGSETRVIYKMTRSYTEPRGIEYGGYIITVKDVRGEIIAYRTNKKWLYKCLGKIDKMVPGWHFNKNGDRVGPARPGKGERPNWLR